MASNKNGHTGFARPGLRSEAGSVLILTALSMVLLLGIAAIAVDASFMYTEKDRMAAAADAAAKAAALERRRGGADLQAFGSREVVAHGFGPADVVVHVPPISGPFAGQTYYAEATVSRATNTFFGQILGWASLTPAARAVAGTANPTYCFIINQNLQFDNSSFTLNGCDLGVGGDATSYNGGSGGGGNSNNAGVFGDPTPNVNVGGDCIAPPCSGGRMGDLQANTGDTPDDPLKLTDPITKGVMTGQNCTSFAAPTVGAGLDNTGTILSPGCYTNIPVSVTTLSPGYFAVNGIFDISGHTVTGNGGVMLYLVGTGKIFASNSGGAAELAIKAANGTDGFAGIALYGDAGTSLDVQNNTTLSINGAVYMPGTDLDMKNGLTIGNTHCTLWIVKSFRVKSGLGTMDTSGCDASFSNATFLGVSLAE